MTVVEKIYANPFGSETRAKDLFEAACLKGAIGKLKSLIMRKKYTLLDISSLTTDMKVASSHYLGKRKVAIDKIKASEGRCEDFDLSFHPLKSHNQQRWIVSLTPSIRSRRKSCTMSFTNTQKLCSTISSLPWRRKINPGSAKKITIWSQKQS